MVQAMFDKILRKVIFETELLVLVMVFCILLSSHLIVDASIALSVEQYGLALTAIRVCELIFAFTWLSFSIKMSVDIYRLRRKHFKISSLLKQKRLEEQKKSVASELVMDIVAFYRSYYAKVIAILTLAIAVSSLIFIAVVYLLLNGYMSFWAAVFRWMLNSLMLLVASAVYVYIHRSWGRKLLKVKDSEKKFSELLGGPIET